MKTKEDTVDLRMEDVWEVLEEKEKGKWYNYILIKNILKKENRI